MKRLTISMSDALFDKLNQVENKSLFIRKLIEGELRKGITSSSDSTYESLAGDIEDLHHEIQSLSSRMLSIENQISGVKADPSFAHDKLESDQTANFHISPMPPSENGVSASMIQTTVSDSYTITGGLTGGADKDQGSVFSNISDIQINLSTQDNDKVLPVHSDEMRNLPFRSIINVGVHKEPVSTVTETNERPVNSMIVAPGMADQPQESFSAQTNNPSTPSFVMPELSDVSIPASNHFIAASPERSAPSIPSFVMPELSDVAPSPSPFSVASAGLSVHSSPSFVMPELSDIAAPAPNLFSAASVEPLVPSAASFVIPELSDVVVPSSSPFIAASAEPPVPSAASFVMPELGAIGQPSPSPFEMPHTMSVPSSGNDLQMPSFAAEGLAASGIQMQPPSFMMQEMQAHSPFESVTVQPQIQNNDSSRVNLSSMSMNERLQGNILMYLPHGARIKRSIIRGLVSKKFSAEEIDAQINLMISNRSLLVEVEDGVEYLLRP